MARVSATEVKAIISTSLSGTDLDPFISAATLLVTKLLGNSGLTSDHLKEIERWLAAHFVAVHDQEEVSAKLGPAAADFGGKYGMHLDFTRWGQQVLLLDTTGTLNQIHLPAAQFSVISSNELPTDSDTSD